MQVKRVCLESKPRPAEMQGEKLESDANRPGGIVAAGPVVYHPILRRSPVADVRLADGDVAVALEDRLLHLADRLGDADLAGAGLGAVEDGAAAPHAFAVVQDLQPLVGRVIAAVEDEAVRVHDRRGAQEVTRLARQPPAPRPQSSRRPRSSSLAAAVAWRAPRHSSQQPPSRS